MMILIIITYYIYMQYCISKDIMNRFMATIEYDGRRYAGYQIQNNALTIQEVLERALSRLFNHEIKIVASGRTDTGVSARGQIIHFDSDTTIPADRIPYALEQFLPNDISMTSCKTAPADFHARYCAKSKTYSYHVYVSKIKKPLYDRHYQYPFSINISDMKTAAKALEGTHDFRAFMSSGSSVIGTIRTIENLTIHSNGEVLCIEVTGSGFLYNMVRIIVGTLLDIGRGHLPIHTISDMIKHCDRSLGGLTAPAIGLCLERVVYSKSE